MKVCTSCGEGKPVTEFHRDKGFKDGFSSRCKVCKNKAGRKRYAENPQKYRDMKNSQNDTPERKAKKAAYDAAYYAKNESVIKAKAKATRALPEVKAKRAEYSLRYRTENAGRERARRKKYNDEHRFEILAKKSAKRAASFGAKVYVVLDKDLRKIYASNCRLCGSASDIQADHVIPLARGGHHGVGNLQPLCGGCNNRKSTKLMIEMRTK